MLHMSILRYMVTKIILYNQAVLEFFRFSTKKEQSLKKFKNMLKENILRV